VTLIGGVAFFEDFFGAGASNLIKAFGKRLRGRNEFGSLLLLLLLLLLLFLLEKDLTKALLVVPKLLRMGFLPYPLWIEQAFEHAPNTFFVVIREDGANMI
jgi:hypothetical protein